MEKMVFGMPTINVVVLLVIAAALFVSGVRYPEVPEWVFVIFTVATIVNSHLVLGFLTGIELHTFARRAAAYLLLSCAILQGSTPRVFYELTVGLWAAASRSLGLLFSALRSLV